MQYNIFSMPIYLNSTEKDKYIISRIVRYKKSCAHSGKELKNEEIIEGHEYDKEHYIVVSGE